MGHWIARSIGTLAGTALLLASAAFAADNAPEDFRGKRAHPLDDARIMQLKSFLAESMAKLGIPGVSFALLDANSVVFEGGLGLRQLGHPDLVDANTLFMVASNTTALTTLLLAELVDAGRIRWDQPVTEIYPAFKLGNTQTTRKLLLKHLLCACAGLSRQEYPWIFGFRDITPSSMMTMLGNLQPTSGFGAAFQYNNQLPSAAGYIGARLLYPHLEFGRAYDLAMQEKVFKPLGMKSTTFDMARALAGNHAEPHGDTVDGKAAWADMAFNYAIVPYRPAGGAWSSAHDLIRYVQLELLQGRLPNGRQLVSAANLLRRRVPLIAAGENRSYGMGLESDSSWGVEVVHHGGSLAGFKSDWYFLPEYGVGAVLLTNSDNGQLLRRPFMRRLLELLFDGRSEAADDVAAQANKTRAASATNRERLILPAAADAAAGLAGKYHNADLGDIVVQRGPRGTVFDFGEWSSPVASRKNGTQSFVTTAPTLIGIDFVVGMQGTKRTLTTRDGQQEYVFTEIH